MKKRELPPKKLSNPEYLQPRGAEKTADGDTSQASNQRLLVQVFKVLHKLANWG